MSVLGLWPSFPPWVGACRGLHGELRPNHLSLRGVEDSRGGVGTAPAQYLLSLFALPLLPSRVHYCWLTFHVVVHAYLTLSQALPPALIYFGLSLDALQPFLTSHVVPGVTQEFKIN